MTVPVVHHGTTVCSGVERAALAWTFCADRRMLWVSLSVCNARSGFHLDSTSYKVLSVAAFYG